MSIETAPTIGTRGRGSGRDRGRSSRGSRPSAYPAGTTAMVRGAGLKARAVADAFAGAQSLDGDDRVVSDITGSSGIVEASGGGTMP